MSKTAPWLALAIDWHESEMFEDANNGERLAWIFLLQLVKAQGRAGKVKFRDKAFAEKYRVSLDAVAGMLARARASGAVTVDDEGVVTVVNWRSYQDPKARHSGKPRRKPTKHLRKNGDDFSKTHATTHTTHTNHPPPLAPTGDSPPTPSKPVRRFVKPTVADVAAYCRERGNGIDAAAFMNHYEAKGWLIGKSPMKDWKAAVRTWEQRRQAPRRPPNPGQEYLGDE